MRKHNAILKAARTVLLRNGYLGTSLEQIAAMAAVTKQTVYKHFADKERLFTEISFRRSMRPATRSLTRWSASKTAATSRPAFVTLPAGSSRW